MEQTIRVEGHGVLKVRPNTMRLTIQLTGIEPIYEQALDKSNQVINILKDCLTTIKIDHAELKTTDFHIQPSYKSYADENDVWQNELIGYQYNHQLKLELPIDQQLLGNLFSQMATREISPTIQISHTVKNVEATKKALLREAVKDAYQKAEILAQAANVKLGQIVTMDYRYVSSDIVSAPIGQPLLAKASKATFDINPDDIELKDQVTIVWQIQP